MKKLIYLAITVFLISSCTEQTLDKSYGKTKKKEKQEQVTEKPVPVSKEFEEIEKTVHVTYTTSYTDSSYWYVILDEKRTDGTTSWHGTVSLATPYFDFYEARKQFSKAKGESYFKIIVQISRESVETFSRYNELEK